MPTETLGCCFKISTASWYHGHTNNTDTDTGIPVETSFCIAMLTLWLMPMSSVRMISETGGAAGVAVCADTNVTTLADSIQLRQVTVRIMRIEGGSRERTVSNVLRRRNMSPPGGTTRPPTPGHLIRL